MVPWQYRLDTTKPKSVFSMTLNASNRLYIQKLKQLVEFFTECMNSLLTDA